MTPKKFVTQLAEYRSASVFNPWSQCCAEHDLVDAADRRRANLIHMLEAAIDSSAETMWIARDLGYRGGRRTGVPLTDELHLADAASLMGGIKLERATEGPVMAERTAAIIWRVLGDIGEPIMLWNIFPFHPHNLDDEQSNRCHTRKERETTWPLLQSLIAMLKPRRIVAIGRDAQTALAGSSIPIIPIRHPSYGGQKEFISGMHSLYGVKENAPYVAPTLDFDNNYAAEAKRTFA